MTDHSQETAPSAPHTASVATMAHWAGAAVSFALIAGIGVWGYKVLMRDATGVPVVQALEGPMREAPIDPGGRLADHQGLAVNAVPGTGVADAPPDRIVLAPPPLTLDDEDVAHGALPPLPPGLPFDHGAGAETLPETAGTPLPTADPVAVLAALREGADTAPRAVIPGDSPLAQRSATGAAASDAAEGNLNALVANLTAGAEPLSPLEEATSGAEWSDVTDRALSAAERPAAPLLAEIAPQLPDPETLAAPETAEAAPVPADAALGLARSLRPQLRPERLPVRIAAAPAETRTDATADAAVDAVVASLAARDLDGESLPEGTRLVQIGAFDSPETARAEWQRLMPKFGAYLEDKERVIQRASSGGRVFYRLRAHGFDDLADARRFCAAFVAGGVDCIPVVAR